MMDPLAARVASRYVLAENVPMGKTWERGPVRVHRYRDHFLVTDLVNAGKRGKKVRQMTIAPTYRFKGNHDDWLERMSKNLLDYSSYDGMKALINDILHDYPGEIRLNETEVRGVDVNPAGSQKIEFGAATGPDKAIEVWAEPDDFSVTDRWKLNRPARSDAPMNDSGGETYHDTRYTPNSKTDAKVFYNWLRANLDEAKRMDIEGFKNLWRELKIRYDSH